MNRINPPLAPLRILLWRGWRKRCPECGEGRLYQRWLTLHDRCPSCGLPYLHDQGDLFGPLVFFDRVLFLIPFIVIFGFCVSNPSPMISILAGCVMIFLLLYTLPNRNGACLAFDYYQRRKDGAAANPGSDFLPRS
jgi:uncharacterized protein (DUF983 family)